MEIIKVLIFFIKNGDIVVLDWQYIHLGKGVSDFVFLLVESIDFDEKYCSFLVNLYYKLYCEKVETYTMEQFNLDFRLSLCMFSIFCMCMV